MVSEKSTANEESQEGHEPVYRIHRMWGWGWGPDWDREREGGRDGDRGGNGDGDGDGALGCGWQSA